MKEVLKCPNCGQPTIKERIIYSPQEIKEISLDDYAKRIIENEKKKNFASDYAVSFSSGDLVFQSAKQLVFECSNCGYTKVYDV